MKKIATIPLRCLGYLTTLLGAFGLIVNLNDLCHLSAFPNTPDQPYFWNAYYVMTAISTLFCLSMVVLGMKFMRLKLRFVSLFVAVCALELLYSFGLARIFHPILDLQ
jgi:heme/copper-type cytochrome/quinol oxidase subunit 3